ncbi:MAG TPA: transposase [Acidimicrobiia bacterium]|nr:transposase [Acidimicrobiia bacterium]
MAGMVIGLDPHKASNTIAVLGRDETVHVRRRFDNSGDGLVAMLAAVSEFVDRVWAVEGANGIGRSIAQRLVAAGELVVDVPAKLATRVRVYSTGHGAKTDQTDAVAIARAALHSTHTADGPSRRRERGVEVVVGPSSRADRGEDPVGVSTLPPGS